MAKLYPVPLSAIVLVLLASRLCLPCDAFSADRLTDRRLLVLVDDLAVRSSHSRFFSSLRSRGYELDFKLADDPSLALRRYGQYLYDGLILFSPSVQPAVLDFVDAGHDLILAADSSASDLMREIATDCGVDFDEDATAMVIDHTSYAVSEAEGDHTLISSDDFIKSDVILGDRMIEGPVLFRGIGHSLHDANSLQLPFTEPESMLWVLKVLSASPAAYSANPSAKLSRPSSLTGSAISLVSIVQARNNARVLITGSLDMFSNRFFKSGVQQAGSSINKGSFKHLRNCLRGTLPCCRWHEKSGNEQFVTEISKWVFHERGHLKAVNLHHHKVGETSEPSMYRINDDLEYSVEIYEWSGSSWEPYLADDVQVQFYMMSPYVLKTLSTDQKGLYSTSFKVPDVYGVFQFKLDYQKLGYTSLSLSKQIPVQPFRHNEYERFITTAFPYYGASFSTRSYMVCSTRAREAEEASRKRMMQRMRIVLLRHPKMMMMHDDDDDDGATTTKPTLLAIADGRFTFIVPKQLLGTISHRR